MKKTMFTEKKTGKYRGLYTAIGISILMILAACLYAYQLAQETMEEETSQIAEVTQTTTTQFVANPYDATDTTTDDYHAVAGLKTDVPKETTTVTVATTTATTAIIQTETQVESQAEAAEETISHVLVMPADGEVAQPFSDGELVKSETTGTWQTHNGVDILAASGEPVHAIDNGTVVEVVNDPLWGISVSIDHENGIVSRYCNLNASVEVQEGDAVESGQTIGTIGDTADMESKMESHLHFEVTKGGSYIDPYAYVRNG